MTGASAVPSSGPRRCRVDPAGGLDAGNVRAAVDAVRPAGVDVNSGVEDGRGAKDPAAMRDFLHAARAALERQAGRA